MLSKIDLRDFFEINQGLYNDPASPAQVALFEALTQVMERTAMNNRAQKLVHEHDATR